MSILAVRLTERTTKTGLTGYEAFDLYFDHMSDNGGKALILVPYKFSVSRRVSVNELVIYLDSSRAYKVNIRTIGKNGISKIPSGFTAPTELDISKYPSWIAVDGTFELVEGSSYVIETEPTATLSEFFDRGYVGRTYVLKLKSK